MTTQKRRQDKEAYLFQLDHKSKLSLRNGWQNKAVIDNRSYLVHFGNGDLSISPGCLINRESYSNLGVAYEKQSGIELSAQLDTEIDFKVKELEVY